MRLAMSGRISGDKLEWLRSLGQLAEPRGPVYLVGGPVRDLILGRLELDTDIAVEGDALDYARRLAERDGAKLVEYPEFYGATVTYRDGSHVDVTACRSEAYPQPGALPEVSRADIRQDLRRRDFTINAIAVSLSPANFGKPVDPYDGYCHLRQGRLQALHDQSFLDDATRILRAARFAARLGLRIEQATAQWISSAMAAEALATVSAERLVAELRYLFAEPAARWALELLSQWGALEALGLDTGAAGRLLPLDNLLPARHDLMLRPEPGALLAASLGLLMPPERLAGWLAGWPLTSSEQQAAGQAAIMVHHPPVVVFSTSPQSSKLYGALHGLSPAALLACWAAGNTHVRENLRRFCRRLADVQADISGEDLLALGYEAGPRFKPALAAALAAKLDRDADRDAQIAEAVRLLEGPNRH